MNKRVSILVLLLTTLFSSVSTAQQHLAEGVYTINNVRYTVEKSNRYSFYVVRKENKPVMKPNRDVVDNIPLMYIDTRVNNENEWKQLVKNTLGAGKVNALIQGEEKLAVTFYLQPNGKIIYSTFRVDINTILNLDDIARVDCALRENYTAALTSKHNAHQHLYWISINDELNFRE